MYTKIIRSAFLLCALQLLTTSAVNAQNSKWPVTIYGSESGLYEGAPVIDGYLILNSKYLKGLIHRTYLKGSSLDTVLNSDTLYGRIKLCLLSNPRHMDIELPKGNIFSIPGSYILSVVGTSFENRDARVPLTRWIIFAPGKYLPFGYPPFRRLVAQKDNVLIYDSSVKDTVEGGYLCPMILYNGHERMEIFNRFSSTIGTLRKFIKKRYDIHLDLSKLDSKDAHFLINYIAEQENILLYKKK
ncbi:MAG TPA: hypothetical protein VGS79_19470 [Puia sp.]|nr:hypothetical protein [Puia sp.]